MAYILVSTIGYSSIPTVSFFMLFIAMSGFIELVCILLGELFGWIALIVFIIGFGLIISKTPDEKTDKSCKEEKPKCC